MNSLIRMMPLAAAALLLVVACSPGPESGQNPAQDFARDSHEQAQQNAPRAAEQAPEWTGEARSAAAALGRQLMTELTGALAEGGPDAGVAICRERAPAIAARVSDDRLQVGRTALRTRNPDNRPDAWEESVLQQFKKQMEAGRQPETLESWTVESREGQHVGRWMKAIPTAPKCLVCHGETLAPELAEKIDELYPQDQARGFSVGELRGAFTVQVSLPDAKPASRN